MSPRPQPVSYCTYDVVGLALLSFASGATDVLAFLKLGHVFTSAMTGNTALLAIAIGQGDGAAAGRSLIALLGFAIGVTLATVVNAASQGRSGACHNPTQLLLFELVFLLGCTALWSENPEPMQGCLLYVIVGLSAVSMGIQAVTARTVNASGISTIVFTTAVVRIVTSLTGAVAGSTTRESPPPSITSEAATFLSYAGGALVVGILALQAVWLVVWVPAVAVILALTVWAWLRPR